MDLDLPVLMPPSEPYELSRLPSMDPVTDYISSSKYYSSQIDKTAHIFRLMIARQTVLNRKIGEHAWKKYLSSIIWNYVTTFINFAITLLTALSTGQAASSSFLTKQQNVIILLVTFVLSTTNSFFKLNVKMNLNFEALKKYQQFGAELETIYYQTLENMDDVHKKLTRYDILHSSINAYIGEETIENQNYITDMIYLVIRNYDNNFFAEWIKTDDRYYELDGELMPRESTGISSIIKNVFKTSKARI